MNRRSFFLLAAAAPVASAAAVHSADVQYVKGSVRARPSLLAHILDNHDNLERLREMGGAFNGPPMVGETIQTAPREGDWYTVGGQWAFHRGEGKFVAYRILSRSPARIVPVLLLRCSRYDYESGFSHPFVVMAVGGVQDGPVFEF